MPPPGGMGKPAGGIGKPPGGIGKPAPGGMGERPPPGGEKPPGPGDPRGPPPGELTYFTDQFQFCVLLLAVPESVTPLSVPLYWTSPE